ncbi:short-chain alcohol dehydrogenase [Rivularia sp. PCC 7116]|uniref:SDR family NAD(P)-dependent oxidoreductase n=1 Tax=Rivularia sp. PCC 7116 TaxID=373994 RepID=UPI00029ECAC5|nr:SDR family NAD(P)-dependent oxidoreductase [Rivularia sp. PCC 7116]AFY54602.1 short-chain alcohol dehydrogenase [Rivularia sp. PCC 7116]
MNFQAFPANSAILIAAASSGIGAACAKKFAQQGVWVFAGVRNLEKGTALQQEAGDNITPVLIDVTDLATIEAAVAHISKVLKQRDATLTGLLNNAAQEYIGPFELLPLEWVRQEMEVGYFGYLSMIKAFLPLLRQSQGRIVNVSSINGRCVFPTVGSGCATKYAIEALSDALRLELVPWNIKVALIEPGAIATPLWQKSHATFEKLPSLVTPKQLNLYYPCWQQSLQKAALDTQKYYAMGIPVQKAVDVIAHALFSKKPKVRYLLGWDAKLIALARWLLPDWLFDRLAISVFDY